MSVHKSRSRLINTPKLPSAKSRGVVHTRQGSPPPEDVVVPVPAGFRSEIGDLLPDTRIRLRRHGRRGGPAVLVMGGISSGRCLAGAEGWWDSIVGVGGPIDLDKYCAWGIDFAPVADERVRLSPHTQARLIAAALDALAIPRLHALVGASYGGMVGLAFAALVPARLERLCVISAADKPSPLALAWRGVQRRIVEFALTQDKPAEGLALARQLAMITYRSSAEFEQRFQCALGEDGRSDLDRYLVARGEAYIDVMAPRRWLSLSESIDRCFVTPEAINAPTTLVACSSDQIAPLADMEALARRLPRCAGLHTLSSIYGHDAFLKEHKPLGDIVAAVLGGPGHE